jgi:hypothetical protein
MAVLAKVSSWSSLGGFGLQGRLPREKFLVTGQGRHRTIPPLIACRRPGLPAQDDRKPPRWPTFIQRSTSS